ncbi:MAG: hypothetical protein M1822_004201 [Bathelium mastoideum]|nr:MAG: hypothetical protein M1822_004201 [Bathelium mastoideum]
MASVKLQDRTYLTSFNAENPESDYEWDLDADGQEVLDGIVSLLEAEAIKPLVLESIEEDAPLSSQKTAIVPKIVERNNTVHRELGRPALPDNSREASIEIEYDKPSRTAFRVAQSDGPEIERHASTEPEAELPEDTRSPIQRFRTAPKKPLSVTDFASPAWCELQYWFTLVKFGRKRATPAMKQGTKVHKALEEELYTAVPITTKTKEDMYGLKIWNVIQGLRTLRVTGMTRELEVWGLIEGEVVNGIIDELSYVCPDKEAEDNLLKTTETNDENKVLLDPSQTTLEDFFNSSGSGSLEDSNAGPGKDSTQEAPARIYLQDVKTTRKRTLPSGAGIRPTQIQLMLYHHLLTSFISNPLLAASFCARYRLNGAAPFSPTFLAQLSDTDFTFLPEASSQTARTDELFGDPSIVATELGSHNTLNSLWDLMLREYQRTFPTIRGPAAQDTVSTLSPLLTASYRLASDEATLLGTRSFVYDATVLESYVRDAMAWWRGEREARGVEVEEAFKCGVCEFADGCGWREKKVEEGVRKARLRREGRRKSEV